MEANELREILDYNPETGIFKWKICTGSAYPGKEAGCLSDDGYVRIRVHKVLYLASRLAWLYMTGDWPTDQIDHINLVKNDNRWTNLREATASQNTIHRRIQSNNSNGIDDVHYCNTTRNWIAGIWVEGVVYYLDSFPYMNKHMKLD